MAGNACSGVNATASPTIARFVHVHRALVERVCSSRRNVDRTRHIGQQVRQLSSQWSIRIHIVLIVFKRIPVVQCSSMLQIAHGRVHIVTQFVVNPICQLTLAVDIDEMWLDRMWNEIRLKLKRLANKSHVPHSLNNQSTRRGSRLITYIVRF